MITPELPRVAPTTKEDIMHQRWFQLFTIISFPVAMLLSLASLSFAQLDAARGSDYEKSTNLVAQITDEIKGFKMEPAKKSLVDFESSFRQVSEKLKRTDNGLHDLDREWLKSTVFMTTVGLGEQTLTAAVKLGNVLGKEDPSSALNDFRNAWSNFKAAFDEFWKVYTTRVKEIEDRAKRYRAGCGGC
jgi:hypothetical protein